MKKLLTITFCAILALLLCSCEKPKENHDVAFIMSVELKQIPAGGHYKCIMNDNRGLWAEKEYTKSDMPVIFKVNGGAATWSDKYHTISFEYRPTIDVDPVVLCSIVTPTLAELASNPGEKFPHDLIYVEDTELGQLRLALHYIYR